MRLPHLAPLAALLAALAFCAPQSLQAAPPKNALGAIAVAPGGDWVVAAGDNLTLYLIDAKTMTVHSRYWIGLNPDRLAFSADAKTLVLIDSESSLTFLDTATFQPRSAVKNLRHAAVLAQADRIIGMTNPQKKDGKTTTDIVVHAMSDGAEVMRTTVEAEGAAVGGSADGSTLALLTRAADTTAETKTKAPDDKKGFDRDVFEQQNDAKASEALILDAAGTLTARHPLWFSTGGAPSMAIVNGQVHVIEFDNQNLRIDVASGTSEMYQVGDNLVYGLGFSPDHASIATGGLAEGSIGATGGAVTDFKTDRVGNWPEYIKGMTFAPDGSVYAGTTGYRLLRIGAGGQVMSAIPVY
jgi:hypothetical protein